MIKHKKLEIKEIKMIYRNGIKEYLLMTALFGLPMGLFFGLLYLSFTMGFIFGVLSGLLFTLFMFLFMKYQEKKFDKKREEIAKERKIICDGAATIQGTGGWMFLTEQGLEFYPHKINISQDELIIPMNRIKSVKTNKNLIIINTTENLMYAVVVSHNKDWKIQIESCFADPIKK